MKSPRLPRNFGSSQAVGENGWSPPICRQSMGLSGVPHQERLHLSSKLELGPIFGGFLACPISPGVDPANDSVHEAPIPCRFFDTRAPPRLLQTPLSARFCVVIALLRPTGALDAYPNISTRRGRGGQAKRVGGSLSGENATAESLLSPFEWRRGAELYPCWRRSDGGRRHCIRISWEFLGWLYFPFTNRGVC